MQNEMNWLGFFASVVSSLAWPCSMIAVIWLLRDDFRELHRKVRTLRYGEMEASFGQELQETIEDAKTSDVPLESARVPTDPDLLALVEKLPHLAVVESWQRLESEMRRVLKNANVSEKPTNLAQLIRSLRSNNLITADTALVIDRLRNLRNKAAHRSAQGDISTAEAYEFLDLASQVEKYLGKK